MNHIIELAGLVDLDDLKYSLLHTWIYLLVNVCLGCVCAYVKINECMHMCNLDFKLSSNLKIILFQPFRGKSFSPRTFVVHQIYSSSSRISLDMVPTSRPLWLGHLINNQSSTLI